eukprot:CAMPEP_0174841916 /NCGR_PEP_ID=MMETSP1114-20130205/9613_1 /TAXON_ID=312471 /ORGANISM="Neobodo designis, Strain CCAP 1951/1" /LENGTH=425 /DNA_ID=CAMNT_0016076115 /DNA_START=86 /DNA_END=1363 /DNA_ORIENTATION=+
MSESVSVAAFHSKCVDDYNAILDSTLPSASDEAQAKVTECCANFGKLMEHMRNAGVRSRNEQYDDMSTQALGLLTVPYYLGQLAGRRVTGADHKARKEVLAVSTQLLREFLDMCENVNLLEEDEVEKRLEYRALDRNSRIEAHRRKKDLTEKLNALDRRVGYEEAKIRRMRRIAAADDDDSDDGDDTEAAERILARREAAHDREADRGGADAGTHTGDGLPDELLRERHVLRARLCIEEAFETIQMNQREADMLGGLTEEEMKDAREKYQEALTEDRRKGDKKSSNLHFPATKMPDLSDPELARIYYSKETGVHGPMVQVPQSGVNYRVAGCGHREPIARQEAYDTAFQDRNAPTMTLQEFAEQETAFVQEQMRLQAEAMNRQEEENAMLGAEGIEERERKKASEWADWKDDNPPVGLTNKGNYS